MYPSRTSSFSRTSRSTIGAFASSRRLISSRETVVIDFRTSAIRSVYVVGMGRPLRGRG